MNRPIKVLIIAPIVLPLTSRLKYGGIERVIMSLTEGLAKKEGVQVIVAASKDSRLGVKTIHSGMNSLWKHNANTLRIVTYKTAHEKHFRFCLDYARENKIDIIHDHAEMINSEIFKHSRINIPVVSTLHGSVNKRHWKRYQAWRTYQEVGRNVHFVAISNSQRRDFEKYAGLKVAAVVHNGISAEKYPYLEKKQNYLFWIGRITKDKGTDLAIKVAKASGVPLILAGDVHTVDMKFYNRRVKNHITRFLRGHNEEDREEQRMKIVRAVADNEKIINDGEILFVGPVDDSAKKVLYSNALATLAINRWKEPFGLFLPESMATGTPIIGTNLGSIPEIVIHKKTGYLIDVPKERLTPADEKWIVKQASDYVSQLGNIEPIDCRNHVKKRFSKEVMAEGYLKIFETVIENGQTQTRKWHQYLIPGRTPTFSEELHS